MEGEKHVYVDIINVYIYLRSKPKTKKVNCNRIRKKDTTRNKKYH